MMYGLFKIFSFLFQIGIMKTTVIYTLAVTLAYYVGSILLFNKIYNTSEVIIDELFHLPQGKAYCEYDFNYWNDKITTLPGLYICSSVIGMFFECTTYNLRFLNLIASGLNLILFSIILRCIYGNQFKTVLLALNFALLPPLYFFSHLYYTDVLSLMFVLAFSLCSVFNKNKLLTLVLGICCIMMRQTNIVWIAMVFGRKMLELLLQTAWVQSWVDNVRKHNKPNTKKKLKRYYNLSDLINALVYHIKTGFLPFFRLLLVNDWLFIFTHIILLGSFIGFVIWNGSIVVGDKQAHVATLHIPQMFYFLLFYGVFSLPHVVIKILSTLKLMLVHKLKVLFFIIFFLLIVHYNTIVHPYLLADNRHYTFYIWNRWFGKYDYAIYATVPLYVFLLFNLYDNLRQHNCVTFLVTYTICTFVALSLQKMIEVRYFLIPYIILRMRFANPSIKLIIFEFIWYLLLNFVTFYIFFNKEIMWNDFNYPQRIIW